MENEPVARLSEAAETNLPLLSIIIPSHNRPHMVMNAVQSALAQSLEHIEVIDH